MWKYVVFGGLMLLGSAEYALTPNWLALRHAGIIAIGLAIVAAIWLTIVGLARWVERITYDPQKPRGGEAKPLDNEAIMWVRRLYKDFVVNARDFCLEGDRLYRVNGNGKKILVFNTSTKKEDFWLFDAGSGEWFKKYKNDGPRQFVEVETYSRRYSVSFSKYKIENDKSQYVTQTVIVTAVFGAATIAVGVMQILSGDSLLLAILPGFGFVFGLYAVADFVKNKKMKGAYERIVGPEPLERAKGEDFGPASATSAPNHPAGDDLEYKPTV